MRVSKEQMLLYIVTDRAWLGENKLADQVEQSVGAGATFVQLREKDLPQGDFIALALEIRAVTHRLRVPFVINDNPAVMEACGADGLHIGQGDMPAAEARRLLGPDKILGVSANSVASALAARDAGADYLGVGAVFNTSTKRDASAVSTDTLRAITAAVDIPVVAIGGIGRDNILELRGAGLSGVAVVSAVFARPDIAAATRELRALVQEVAG